MVARFGDTRKSADAAPTSDVTEQQMVTYILETEKWDDSKDALLHGTAVNWIAGAPS